MKKQAKRLLPAGMVCLCMLSYAVTMLPQDRIFSEYRQAFARLQHPSGTEFVASYHAFGALEKTRVMYREDFPQGCDYRVAEIRRYSGRKEAIQSFYDARTIEIRGELLSPGVLFLPLSQAGRIDPLALSREELAAWGPGVLDLLENLQADRAFLGLQPSASYYYVSIGGFSRTAFDLRCQF